MLFQTLVETVDAHYHEQLDLAFWALQLRYLRVQDEPIAEIDEERRTLLSSIVKDLLQGSPIPELLCQGAQVPGAVPLLGVVHAHQPQERQKRYGTLPKDAPHSDFDTMEQFLQASLPKLVTRLPAEPPVPVLRLPDGECVVIVVHMFSGRRRARDARWWTAAHAAGLMPAHRVLNLAMDTAVDAQDGNLLRGAGYNGLRELIAANAVAGCLAGPPCETWSQARHNQIEGRRAPIPLRSSSRPWGFLGLSRRNLEQLLMGSRLMLTDLANELEIALRGASSSSVSRKPSLYLAHPGAPVARPFDGRTPRRHRPE